MSSNIWVYTQGDEGVPTSATLELLTKARTLADGGTVTAFVEGAVDDLASTLGDYGATKVYETGDLEGRLPGPAVAAAMKAVIDGGDVPDIIIFPQDYEGRDVLSRLSVKLDKPVLTNNTDIEVADGKVKVTTPVFGGTQLVTTTFTGEGPHLVAFRPKSFAAEAAAVAHRMSSLRPCRSSARRVRRGSRPCTSRSTRARSSTRPTSSSPAAAGSARHRSTR